MNPSSSAWAALDVPTRLTLRSGSSNPGTLNFNKTAAENAHKAFFFLSKQQNPSLHWKVGNSIQEKLRRKKKKEGREKRSKT